MTVEVYAGPGNNSKRSTRFAASINGATAYVYGYTRSAAFTVSGIFVLGDDYQSSFFTFGMDEAQATAVVTLVAGSITSANVYPTDVITSSMWSVAGGALTITIPANTNVWIEVNGNRGEPLFIFANDLKEAVPGDAITYNGTQVAATAGTTLYFGPGIYDLVTTGAWSDKLFPVESTADVYLDPNAYVIGSFDVRGILNYTIRGHGVLSGEWITSEDFHALNLPFTEGIDYTLIHGYDLAFPAVGGNEIRGVTLLVPPFYATANATNYYTAVKIIAPWYFNCNGFTYVGDGYADNAASLTDCFGWCGDDVMNIGPFARLTGDNNTFASTGSAAVLLDYFGRTLSENLPSSLTNTKLVSTVSYYTSAAPAPAGVEGSCLIQCWVDTTTQQRDRGFDDFTMDGIHIDGPVVDAPIWNIKNRLYPWGSYNDAAGQIFSLVFRNVVCVATPEVRSILQGLDGVSTPHDIRFDNVSIGGVLLNVRNKDDFFDINSYPYRIYFGSRLMVTAVDICNTALSYVGERDRVTSIAPVDGSEESRQAARAYAEAFEELMEMHNWSFNTKKIQLTVVNVDSDDTDDPAWAYRYEIPDGMAEALAVLPDDHMEDYVIGSAKQPQNFHIKVSTTDDELRIYSNTPDAWLRYTVYVTDPNRLSRLAVAAMTWLMASKLAGTVVRGDSGEAIKNRCLATFGKYLAEAKLKDAKQRQVSARPETPWMVSRRGSNPWDSRAPAVD